MHLIRKWKWLIGLDKTNLALSNGATWRGWLNERGEVIIVSKELKG